MLKRNGRTFSFSGRIRRGEALAIRRARADLELRIMARILTVDEPPARRQPVESTPRAGSHLEVAAAGPRAPRGTVAGATGWLMKPVAPRRLLAVIFSVMRP